MGLGKNKSIKIGYEYYFGIHMGLGRGPVDEITHIKVGDKTAWQGSVTGNTSVYINKSKLFGGEKGEGGIKGTLNFFFGEPDQSVHSGLASMLGGLVPAFRGVTTLYYNGLVTAMNPYPKPWAVRKNRTLKGWDGEVWYPEKAMILLTDSETGGQIKAMNPAHILYQLETDRDWGRGKPRSRIDDTAYRAAADKLYDEGFGLCLRWVKTDSIANFGSSVLAHIGGNLFSSRTTGLRKLTLVRDDYDPDSLPHFTPDTGLLEVVEDDNSTTSDAVNEVRVSWRNPIDKSDRTVRERNLAGVRAAGGRVLTANVDYIGLPTQELAARVAKRDLRAKGNAKRWKLVLDRRARDIEPGQAFKFSDPNRGLSNVVVRAGRIEDEGRITITAVLDVFGLPSATFSSPVPSGWIPPDTTPQSVTTRRLVEATWRDLILGLDAANLAEVSDSAGYIRTLAERPTSLALNYDIQSRIGVAEWLTKDSGDFCPSAVLVAGIDPDETTATLSGGVDLSLVEAGSAAQIGNEIIRIDSIDLETNVITFGRGCVDTVPAIHLAGDRVWFVDDLVGADPTPYTASTSVDVRLITNTSSDQLDPALAGIDTLTITARHNKPFPPANLQINSLTWPATIDGDIAITWAHRDRELIADQLVDTTTGDIGPEPGTTYDVVLFNNSTDAVIATHADIAGTSDTILETELTGIDGVEVRLEVYSKRGGIESLYRQTAVFTWNEAA